MGINNPKRVHKDYREGGGVNWVTRLLLIYPIL
jgi:hypothetical protein